jgi:hypothetical protein
MCCCTLSHQRACCRVFKHSRCSSQPSQRHSTSPSRRPQLLCSAQVRILLAPLTRSCSAGETEACTWLLIPAFLLSTSNHIFYNADGHEAATATPPSAPPAVTAEQVPASIPPAHNGFESFLQQSNACIAHGAAIKSSRVVTLHVLQYAHVVLHIQAAAAAARQVPEALTLAPEDLAAPPPAADPLGTGSAGAQTTLAVSSEPAAPAAAPNLPELDRLAKTGQVRAFLIHGANAMQAMPCYGNTLLSGAVVACYQEAQTATKLRP